MVCGGVELRYVAVEAGDGPCYIEFGGGLVGKAGINFLGGPAPTAQVLAPSRELAAEKQAFGATRRQSWFGRPVGGDHHRYTDQPGSDTSGLCWIVSRVADTPADLKERVGGERRGSRSSCFATRPGPSG